MLSPKEKAKLLVDAFKEYTEDRYAESWQDAKQCALIVVREIKDTLTDTTELCWWQEVEAEINKM